MSTRTWSYTTGNLSRSRTASWLSCPTAMMTVHTAASLALGVDILVSIRINKLVEKASKYWSVNFVFQTGNEIYLFAITRRPTVGCTHSGWFCHAQDRRNAEIDVHVSFPNIHSYSFITDHASHSCSRTVRQWKYVPVAAGHTGIPLLFPTNLLLFTCNLVPPSLYTQSRTMCP